VITNALPLPRAQDDDEADQTGERPPVRKRIDEQADPADEHLGHVRWPAVLADDTEAEPLHSEGLTVVRGRPEHPVPQADQHEQHEEDDAAEDVQERAVAVVERYRHQHWNELH
jgi:hypothetical protein